MIDTVIPHASKEVNRQTGRHKESCRQTKVQTEITETNTERHKVKVRGRMGAKKNVVREFISQAPGFTSNPLLYLSPTLPQPN